MILLFEYSDAKVRSDKKGCCYVEGCIAKADYKNRNNRVYPESVLSEAMQELSEKVNHGNAYGMLGHSPNPGIEHDKISHVIESVKQVGKDWHSRVRLIPEGAGKIASAILESGGKLGFSTKSIGDVERHRDGYDVIKPGLTIHSVDLVGDPSSGEFAKQLKESILTESYSPQEKEIAMKILADNDTPSLIERTVALIEGRNLGMDKLDKLGHGLSDLQSKMEYDNTGGIYDGHASFDSLPDDKTSHYDRMWDLTLKMIERLLDLEGDMERVDNSHADNEGFSTARRKYMDVAGKAYRGNVEDVIRHMMQQPRMKDQMVRFQQQQELKRKARRDALNRIFKGKV